MSLYRIIRPLLFRLPPESAHDLAVRSLTVSLKSKAVRALITRQTRTDSFEKLNRFGLEFPNPLGLAAGFDKHGTGVQALCALGFGFIEVGTVTNEPQPGNPRPRLFRLPGDRALINRLGFNNCGARQMAANLRAHRPDCLLGVNIGKSRSVPIENAIPDYLATFDAVFEVADYIAINVSSPNTPQLRELQKAEHLKDLLGELQKRNFERESPKPLLLKIAPDLSEAEIEAVIDVAMHANISGIIATNTTVSREGLRTPPEDVALCGAGGLSGAPLRGRANEVISFIYRLTRGRLPIVGVGGIFSAEDAWEKICAGAGLIQLYTGFIYEGPRVARRINEGLVKILEREGLNSIDEAVGSGTK
ncbi:MAG TPA: quinone-dependent dihydroorotate dehydrogenase [Pyrinomonadaceae bacterium]|nr:quinone-dependent dihydroorotate dehydrogenase [Pyrinomonadaceae bacterium]